MCLPQMIKEWSDKWEQRDAEKKRKLRIVKKDPQAVDKSPWMRRTAWLQEFGGKNMEVIARMGLAATGDEHGLLLVSSSVARVFERCVDGIADCWRRRWLLLLFWLNSNEKDKPDSRPFMVEHEKSTVKRYVGYWQRFLCYCLRILGNEAEHGAGFLPRQRELLGLLKTMVEPNNPAEGSIDALVMELSVQFAMHLDFASCRSALVQFCDVLGYDTSTGRFRLPGTYTPILAGLQFCIRVLLFEHALPTGSRDDFKTAAASRGCDVGVGVGVTRWRLS